MKNIFLFIAFVAIGLSACTGKAQGQSSSNNASASSGKQIITEEKATNAESTARMYYLASSQHEEFTFDRNGTLTKYLRIYTFVDGANKENGLEAVKGNGAVNARIEGNTIVIEGDYSATRENKDITYDKVKSDLNEAGTKYTER